MSKNDKRAKRIEATLEVYKAKQLKEAGALDEDTYTDFLTDLRHHCEKSEIDLYALLDRSYQHYLAEKAGADHE